MRLFCLLGKFFKQIQILKAVHCKINKVDMASGPRPYTVGEKRIEQNAIYGVKLP